MICVKPGVQNQSITQKIPFEVFLLFLSHDPHSWQKISATMGFNSTELCRLVIPSDNPTNSISRFWTIALLSCC